MTEEVPYFQLTKARQEKQESVYLLPIELKWSQKREKKDRGHMSSLDQSKAKSDNRRGKLRIYN